VSANYGAARAGKIDVAGQSVIVNQAGFTNCSFNISPLSAAFQTSGGPGYIDVSSSQGCSWTALSGADWIILTTGAAGSGSGRVTYTVAANSGASRQGTISVAGQTFSVTQSGTAVCTYTLSSSSSSVPASGALGSILLTTQAGCGWTAVSNAPWITLTSGTKGSGSTSVAYSVSPNSGSARNGSVTIAGQTFTVTQADANAGVCSYDVFLSDSFFSASGGQGRGSINTASGCRWTAASNADWIQIISDPSGSGFGRFSFVIAPNDGGRRAGTLTIGEQTYTVMQEGAPLRNSFPAGGRW
ncbi:MAG TPA: BACON domain-containing carbohydrate-binding protein, partial [Thermodesulfobacteriota bacterium]|nr:BACON domain-containing carbohydrate-binding protein [Thermodesulfobacteriota bacterium]